MTLRTQLLGLAAVSLTTVAAYANPSVYPTGTTIYDPAKAYNSYVIFSAPDGKSHLIDMAGHEVHNWYKAGFPSYFIDPKLVNGARGHVLVQLESIEQQGAGVVPNEPPEFRNKTIGELDWDGKTVWSWGPQAPGGAAKQHHDYRRLPNGNTLVLAHLLHHVEGFQQPTQLDDVLYEVTPKGAIVWQWIASDHLDELGFTPAQITLIRNTNSADYFHINNANPVGANKWADAGDTRFAPDNIILDSRNANFIAIIDRKTGHIAWEIGPNYPKNAQNSAFRRTTALPRPVDQISGQHDAHIIADGLPGAGNLLVFDNQGEAGYPAVELGVNAGSRVLEIDPITKQIVWQYSADLSDQPGWAFYSSFISSARRLPNGNTLIDEGMNGRLFQVTPKGEIVWEYVSPFFGKTPVGSGGGSVTANWIYRAQPVPYAWVPDGTAHDETPVKTTDIRNFHIPG